MTSIIMSTRVPARHSSIAKYRVSIKSVWINPIEVAETSRVIKSKPSPMALPLASTATADRKHHRMAFLATPLVALVVVGVDELTSREIDQFRWQVGERFDLEVADEHNRQKRVLVT